MTSEKFLFKNLRPSITRQQTSWVTQLQKFNRLETIRLILSIKLFYNLALETISRRSTAKSRRSSRECSKWNKTKRRTQWRFVSASERDSRTAQPGAKIAVQRESEKWKTWGWNIEFGNSESEFKQISWARSHVKMVRFLFLIKIWLFLGIIQLLNQQFLKRRSIKCRVNSTI